MSQFFYGEETIIFTVFDFDFHGILLIISSLLFDNLHFTNIFNL